MSGLPENMLIRFGTTAEPSFQDLHGVINCPLEKSLPTAKAEPFTKPRAAGLDPCDSNGSRWGGFLALITCFGLCSIDRSLIGARGFP